MGIVEIFGKKHIAKQTNKKQAQHRAAAETATRKLTGHFKRSMYDMIFYRHHNCQIW